MAPKFINLLSDGKISIIRQKIRYRAVWQLLQQHPLILEEFIPFERGLSIIAVRGLNGELRFYPLTEN